MQTFDLDKLMSLVDNKFHLVIGIVERVNLLKRGVEAKVPRRNRDLITVAMEEMEHDLLSFEVSDLETGDKIKAHSSEREAMVTPEMAREEALAAQNATLGFGTNIDRRPLAVPVPAAAPAEESAPADAASNVPEDARATEDDE